MMQAPDTLTGPLNLGNPQEFSIRAIAEKVIDLSGSTSKIVQGPLPEDDAKRRQPDISKAREQLDWAPAIDLDDGLKRTIAYFDSLFSKSSS